MRAEQRFILQLRAEIAAGQRRRHSFVLAKLAFVVGLLGLGAYPREGEPPPVALLYLIPLVTFIFDLYIVGEDFGIKRAGRYLRDSPAATSEEEIWEKAVGQYRDQFTHTAAPLSSLLALAAAAGGLVAAGVTQWLWPWLFIGGLLVVATAVHRRLQRRPLAGFDLFVKEERSLVASPSNEPLQPTSGAPGPS